MRKTVRILLATAILMLMLTLCCFGASALENVCKHEWLSDFMMPGEVINNCNEGGELRYYCMYCPEEKIIIVEPKEHELEYYEEPDLSTFCGTQTIYVRCNDCPSWVTMTFEGTKEHDWTYINGDDEVLDCTQGLKLYYSCRDCDEEKIVTEEPKEHAIYWISNNDATCTKDGTKSSYCSKCGRFDYRTIETVTDEGTALGHDHSGEWTVLLPATCSDRGVQIKNCQRCLNAITSEVLPALEHIDADGDKICDSCSVNLGDSSAPDQSEPDEPSTEPDNTPTEPETPAKNDNVFSFLTDFLKELLDFFKSLFKF